MLGDQGKFPLVNSHCSPVRHGHTQFEREVAMKLHFHEIFCSLPSLLPTPSSHSWIEKMV